MKKNKIPELVELSSIHKMTRKNAVMLYIFLLLFTGALLYISFPDLLNILEVGLLLVYGYSITWMDDNEAWGNGDE